MVGCRVLCLENRASLPLVGDALAFGRDLDRRIEPERQGIDCRVFFALRGRDPVSAIHEARAPDFHERFRSAPLWQIVHHQRQRTKGDEERPRRRYGSRVSGCPRKVRESDEF